MMTMITKPNFNAKRLGASSHNFTFNENRSLIHNATCKNGLHFFNFNTRKVKSKNNIPIKKYAEVNKNNIALINTCAAISRTIVVSIRSNDIGQVLAIYVLHIQLNEYIFNFKHNSYFSIKII